MAAVGDATEDIQKIGHLRHAPGILVLSADHKVLHVNQRGWELIHDFDNAKLINTPGMLPGVVSEVFEDLQRIARERFPHKDVTHIEVRRMGAARPHPILVRGLVLPGSGRSGSHSRILILLERVGREKKKERFRFTDREGIVFQNLPKGRSNQEIALDLTFAEQTEDLDHTDHGL